MTWNKWAGTFAPGLAFVFALVLACVYAHIGDRNWAIAFTVLGIIDGIVFGLNVQLDWKQEALDKKIKEVKAEIVSLEKKREELLDRVKKGRGK